MKSNHVIDGLAVYKIGKGEPLLLMPYPHASTSVPMAESELVEILTSLGRSVLTFDPPGIFKSTRQPTVDLKEMFCCTQKTLDYFEITDKIDFIGHSMGSFCSLAFAIHYPTYVKKLVLIGSTTGWKALRRGGVHKNWKWHKDKEYWQCLYWGGRIILGVGNLKIHKQLSNLVEHVSFVDKKYVKLFEINPGDAQRPAPTRSKWMTYLRKNKLDFSDQIKKIESAVLICVGKFDPQTSVMMNKELNNGIKNSELVIFNSSGHAPFIEESDKFTQEIKQFLLDTRVLKSE